MTGLVDLWTLEKQWSETPRWLRWLGKPKYRARVPQDNVRNTIGYWIYSDTFPSYGGINRSAVAMWKTRVAYRNPDDT